MLTGEPGLVLCPAAVRRSHEQDAEQDPRRSRDPGDAVEPGAVCGGHPCRGGRLRVRLNDFASVSWRRRRDRHVAGDRFETDMPFIQSRLI